MATTTREYAKTAVNKLGRLPKRGAYDYETVHGVIDSSPILHVAFNDPAHAFPVVLPMLGCTGRFGDEDTGLGEERDVYIHGWVSCSLSSLCACYFLKERERERS